ncbi:MAG TPA: transketolase [Candidatus Omnitrophica bacterium]|nr:MAG: transketolase [Omnitrophica WOR_2 bacterium GWA2_63_20]OGX35611.1 MAG: transketolase [Omnitrophica WOR_2 bacterium RIFCSPHIGHO2_02_FULL_63_39]OGX46334.1 MAG: transketolase [Omnitrophica WOR_2 bacterium RIFCSPLOWO2_02_FULL_63_16]OGX47108.1 MAG: transketolase [Omnitrophica WOR_2 bacterium RIFCSPLOWO2_12_FULL_63_16]HBH97342.1 transketolase [Candidatus Omnitrophota bacterium]
MLRRLAVDLRQDILRTIAAAGSGHPGGSLSMVELLIGLYWHALRHDPAQPFWPDRDLFLLSKGHGCPALYVVLAARGYFPKEELRTLRRYPTRLQGHPEKDSPPGVEIASGSLGQGLSMANGIALADRLDRRRRRIFCLMGDGEIQEGQVWEAAMTAHHHKLEAVCAIVDANQLQQNGPVAQIQDIEPLADKWRAFGWHTLEIDGHDIVQVIDAYDKAQTVKGQPQAIVARTVKGKGVSFMELNPAWHGVAPKPDELEKALSELDAAKAKLS